MADPDIGLGLDESLSLIDALRIGACLIDPPDGFKPEKFYPEETARMMAWWARELLIRMSRASGDNEIADRLVKETGHGEMPAF